jgi:hypothetical protein
MRRRWTDEDINAILGWQAESWPREDAPEHWFRLELAIAQARDFVAKFDHDISVIESSPELSQQGKAKRIDGVLEQRKAQYVAEVEFAKAEKLAAVPIKKLQETMQLPPPGPADFASAMLATEVRNHLFNMKATDRISYLSRHSKDRVIVSAVANAPPSLSGLSTADAETFVANARGTLFPDETAELSKLTEALEVIAFVKKRGIGLMDERVKPLQSPRARAAQPLESRNQSPASRAAIEDAYRRGEAVQPSHAE